MRWQAGPQLCCVLMRKAQMSACLVKLRGKTTEPACRKCGGTSWSVGSDPDFCFSQKLTFSHNSHRRITDSVPLVRLWLASEGVKNIAQCFFFFFACFIFFPLFLSLKCQLFRYFFPLLALWVNVWTHTELKTIRIRIPARQTGLRMNINVVLQKKVAYISLKQQPILTLLRHGLFLPSVCLAAFSDTLLLFLGGFHCFMSSRQVVHCRHGCAAEMSWLSVTWDQNLSFFHKAPLSFLKSKSKTIDIKMTC